MPDPVDGCTCLECALRRANEDLLREFEALRKDRDEWKAKAAGQCRTCGLKRSLDEALNSGNGSYRP